MTHQKQQSKHSIGGLAELKARLCFVLIGILVYRLGAHIPVPGLDPQRLAAFFTEQQNSGKRFCFGAPASVCGQLTGHKRKTLFFFKRQLKYFFASRQEQLTQKTEW